MNQYAPTETSADIPIQRSFFGRLLFFMLLIGVIPVVGSALFSYSLARSALSQATSDTQNIIEKDQSAYILNWVTERIQDIETLSGIARISSMNPQTAD